MRRCYKCLCTREFPYQKMSESVLTEDTDGPKFLATQQAGWAVPVYPSRLTLRNICWRGLF